MRSITPQQQTAMMAGKRRAALHRITDPLWHAIAKGHDQEVATLMTQLQSLVEADKRKAS